MGALIWPCEKRRRGKRPQKNSFEDKASIFFAVRIVCSAFVITFESSELCVVCERDSIFFMKGNRSPARYTKPDD